MELVSSILTAGSGNKTKLSCFGRIERDGPVEPYIVPQMPIGLRGCAKKCFPQKSEITMEVGGWVQVSLRIPPPPNSSKPVLIFWSSIPHVFCLYIYIFTCTLIKVVSYYDLSVLSMSVIGLQKTKFGWVWVGGWVSTIQVFFLDFGNFLTLQSPLARHFHFACLLVHGASFQKSSGTRLSLSSEVI